MKNIFSTHAHTHSPIGSANIVEQSIQMLLMMMEICRMKLGLLLLMLLLVMLVMRNDAVCRRNN
jgi:hypothetical protein